MSGRHSNDQLAEEFAEFVRALNNANVQYLVIGGYAVGAHGYLRGTDDFDIWIAPTEENAARMVAACTAYGIPAEALSSNIFLNTQKFVDIGDPPFVIQILNRYSGATFEQAWQRKIVKTMAGIPVNVVPLEDLLANKLLAGRSKDLADIEGLQRQKDSEA